MGLPQLISRGARKMFIILNHEKTTLPIQDIFGVNFFWGAILFSLGQVSVGKILNLYFRGKFEFFGATLNFVLGGFFQFGQICVWEILNIYFEVKFFFI